LLLLGVANLGCHVFTPGLAPRDASGDSSPDTATPIAELPSGEDALPADTQEPLRGPTSKVGCSDGTREGFRDLNLWPAIAGCAGAWQKPGLASSLSDRAECFYMNGNDSLVLDGNFCAYGRPCTKCSVVDLCAPDWHLCMTNLDVASHSPTGCEGILPPGEDGFFIAMTGASANGACDVGQHNDLHGCGNLGQPESGMCAPLTRRMSSVDCANTGGVWRCDSAKDNLHEADTVTKVRSELGGVLCCRD
jgi:hypothetical protein